MSINRYSRAPVLDAGKLYGTSYAISIIRQAVQSNSISTRIIVLHERERLDIIAGREYGDASNWWIIAAASNIGWALQVPPGTRLIVPTNLNEIIDLVA